MTAYEREIYHIITGPVKHLTVEQIYAVMKESYPQIVIATVYNNVNRLWRAGLIRKITVENMPDRYDSLDRHDHLVCQRCGGLTDISFADLTDSLREQVEEDFLSYDLKIYYLCHACAQRDAEQKSS